jgi:hypothetical protein
METIRQIWNGFRRDEGQVAAINRTENKKAAPRNLLYLSLT